MADYKLSATLELKDKFTAVVDKAKSGMKSLTQTLEGAGSSVDRAGSAMEKMGRSAVSAAAKADKAKRSLEGIKGNYTANIQTRDGATSAIRKVSSEIKTLTGKTHNITVGIKQQISGPIVFITSAGGALGAVLKASGAGASLAQMVINTGLPFILIPFVISGLLKVVQGSGTVAVTTAATLCAPIASSLGLNPILIFLASGAGARSCCHVNDSYFWVYTNCMGFDMKTGLKTLSLGNIFMALGGLLATYIASIWL